MDFSRQGVLDKQRDIKSTGKRMESKMWVWLFRLFLVVTVTAGVVGVMAVFGAFKGILDSSPTVYLEDLQSKALYSTSYFSDGTIAQKFAGAEANRVEATIDEIPKVVRDCFVALEDERFYEHNGIDFRGILRAGVSVLEEGGLNYGGSTITQQLIKNLVFSGGNEANKLDKVQRKIQEQYLAVQLEMTLSKDEIMERYLNYVNMGNGAFGIKTAAESYFGKDLCDLNLSEAAVLAPTVLAPTRLNPLTHPDQNAERRRSCLDNMLKLGFCTREEYVDAINDDVYARIADYNETRKHSTYSYFTDELIEQVTSDLQTKLGYTADEAKNMLFYGGIRIYTTQDREIQNIVDSFYTSESSFPPFGMTSSTGSLYELTYELSVQQKDGTWTNYHRSDLIRYYSNFIDSEGLYFHSDGVRKGISELTKSDTDIYEKIDEFVKAVNPEGLFYIEKKFLTPQPQSSFSIIDHHTGEVLAIYGGRGVKTGDRTLNRASNTPRQVGSTFKVLASFLPALDQGGLTLASVFDDSPYFYPDDIGAGANKEVVNWYSSGYRGIQSIRLGISLSLNIVAVKTLEKVGPEVAFNYLEKLGFTTLVRAKKQADGSTLTDINLSIALGGLTSGVTNVELTSAYGAIANGGIYNSPIYYTRIEDKDGNVILENRTTTNQVMKNSTAWLLTSAMTDCVKSGTGTRLKFISRKMNVAGKTGTATKNNDLWFVGFTPYYTASIWSGFDSFYNQKNKTYQQELWRNIMEEIHIAKGLTNKEFEMPDSIVTANICSKCGKLAISGLCDKAEGGSCVKLEYFAKGTAPKEFCDCHIEVPICKTSGKVATQYCPSSKIKTKVLLNKNENYQYTDEQLLILTADGYDFPITTKDSPHVFNPIDLCPDHIPDGLVLMADGRIITQEEYDEEMAIIEAARLAEEEARLAAEEEARLAEEALKAAEQAALDAEREATEAAEAAGQEHGDDWFWNEEAQSWEWLGDDEPGDEEDDLDAELAEWNDREYDFENDPDWLWDYESEGWMWNGERYTDREWDVELQQWVRIEDDEPAVWDEEDEEDDDEDDGAWLWNEETQSWEHLSDRNKPARDEEEVDNDWVWDPDTQSWEWVGDDGWTWDEEHQIWEWHGNDDIAEDDRLDLEAWEQNEE